MNARAVNRAGNSDQDTSIRLPNDWEQSDSSINLGELGFLSELESGQPNGDTRLFIRLRIEPAQLIEETFERRLHLIGGHASHSGEVRTSSIVDMQRFLDSAEGEEFYREALREWESPEGRRRHRFNHLDGRVGWAYDPVSGRSKGYGAGSHYVANKLLWDEIQWFGQDCVKRSERGIERIISGIAKKGLLGFGYPVLELQGWNKDREDLSRAMRKAQQDGYLVKVLDRSENDK